MKTYDNAIHYSYDVEGNVSSVLMDVPHDSIMKQRYKKINYYYDLVSGKVNELIYQKDSVDQLIHAFEYDADKKMTDVMTSHDSLYWENDASYEYYDHGALARKVIGRRQVQGIDYVYTLDGWIKGINSSINNPSYDAGHDGDVHGVNANVARDAFGYTLNYFSGDYRSIGTSNFVAAGLPTASLYNGNISGATYSIKPLLSKTLGYIYNYDQLNRYIGDSIFKNPDTVNNNWITRTGINDFKEKVSYDDNGDILSYLRHGNTAVGPLAMDSLTYHYSKGKSQLSQVNDAVPSTNYTIDIHNETSKRNYQYNGIGELAKDSAAGLDTIMWTVYNKVKEIRKHNGDSIIFSYDPLNNLLEKRYYPHGASADTTKYERDAQGNIIAMYDRHKDTIRLTEWDIYGINRIGSIDTIMLMRKLNTGVGSIDSLTINYLEGEKQYELDNYLGNVLATISDKKIAIDTVSTDTLAKYYLPLVISAQDYYPFGMEQPGRTYLLNGDSVYRFAFNDKLKTDEIYGKGDAYDYGARMLDPRLGRFLSVDPLFKKYSWLTPYQFSEDNPIRFIDIDGKEILNPFLPSIISDASITLATDPNSAKAKAYGATFGVGLALYLPIIGLVTAIEHPVAAAKAIVKSADPTPQGQVENAVNTFVSIYSQIPDAGDNQFTSYALGATYATTIVMTVVPFLSLETKTATTVGVVGADISTEEFGNELKTTTLSLEAKPVDGFSKISADPTILWGKSEDEVGSMLGSGWEPKKYGSKENGWEFVNKEHPDETISYNPEGNSHKGEYYKVTSGTTGKQKVVNLKYNSRGEKGVKYYKAPEGDKK